jgi:hypothetical protein
LFRGSKRSAASLGLASSESSTSGACVTSQIAMLAAVSLLYKEKADTSRRPVALSNSKV